MLNKIKARLNNKKGFTLVELIVVIVIILILAAVLVPNVTKYVANAKRASLQSDASAILAQVQADYTAFVAGEGISSAVKEDSNKKPTYDGNTVNGVTVTFTDSTITTNPADGNAIARYDATNKEIVEFRYTKNGETITWTQTGNWS